MFNLDGKKALVTGASGGIGQAIAEALHAQGASVVLSGTRLAPLEELAARLKDRVFVAPCDLRDGGAVDGLVPRAEELLGGLDILVNNAGITKDNLMLRMTDADFQDVIDVNLGASFRLMRAALRGMMKRRFGRIVNIASIVGVTGNPGQANYCASKAGLIGMSKSLAQEVATRGITVNCVAPGFITSPMTEGLTEAQQEVILRGIPQSAIGVPQDIAAGVVYLASEEAGYITGQTLHINGGMVMV